MKIHLIAVGAVLFGSLFTSAGEQSAPAGGTILEKTLWKITAIPDEVSAKGGAVKFDDTISFSDGKFSSAALAGKGFKPAKYRGDFEENEAEFDLDQESETEGVALWIGEVRKGKMAGRLQWKKKDGTNLIFNFTGAKD